MKDDPIVAEVRRIRHEHAARFKYDLDLIVKDLKAQERQAADHTSTCPRVVWPFGRRGHRLQPTDLPPRSGSFELDRYTEPRTCNLPR